MKIPRDNLSPTFFPKPSYLTGKDSALDKLAKPVEWVICDQPVDYPDSIKAMNARVDAIASGKAAECIWLLEHPPLYTAGTSANTADLVSPERFPVFRTGRGGQYTYHGPGQRIVYVMLDLKQRKQDVRLFIAALERWIIDTLDQFNVTGERREDRVGVWVKRPDKPLIAGQMREDKIAAIGIRLRKWVSLHGFSINVEPELDHFSGIIPCGITEHGVTSLVDLGLPVTLQDLDAALLRTFGNIFADHIMADRINADPPAPEAKPYGSTPPR